MASDVYSPCVSNRTYFSDSHWYISPTFALTTNQESGKIFYELNYVKELLDYLPDISELSKIDFLNMFWMKRRWGPGVANATLINR